jgi:hypothetical protein
LGRTNRGKNLIIEGIMERTLKIKAQFSGVISTGSYENEKPLFELEETIEANGVHNDDWLKSRQNELYQICRDMFKKVERESIVQRIQKERQDIRFYPANGEQFPSVTSIIGWDADWYISPEELVQYGARGSIIDAQVNHYVKTGEWKDAKELPECYPHLVILKKGSLKLEYDDVDFLGFLEKYPIIFTGNQVTVFNYRHKYAGTLDIKGVPIVIEEDKAKKIKPNGWAKLGVKAVPTIFDVKAIQNLDLVKVFKQGTAYWHCEGHGDIEQFIIIQLNKKTEQGYSVPKVLTDKNKYWNLFLEDRKRFNQRFSL